MRAAALLAAAALLVACDRTDHPRYREPPPLPEIDLSAADPLVRQALEARIEGVRAARESGAEAPELVEAWAALGRSLLAQDFGAASERAFAAAERLAPTDFRWPYLKAHALRHESRNEDAREAFRRAAALAPQDVPSAVWVAEAHALLDEHEAARTAVARALALAPDNAMALYRAGRLAADAGEHERAVALFSRALEVQPDADRVHHPLALSLRELGRLDEAQAHLARAGTRKPGQDDPLMAEVQAAMTGLSVLLNRGGLAFDRGDLREALRLFAQAVEIDPESSQAHSNLGAALLVAGNAPLARRHLERGVELAPDSAEARFNLGTFFGRYEEDAPAIAHLSRAVALDPAHERARFNLANALRRSGRCAEARVHFRALLAKDPSHRTARLGEADCLVAETRWAEALAALQQAEELAPDDAKLLALHARFLSCCPDEAFRDGARAVELARRAVRLEPSPDHGRTLALAHHAAGEREEALNWARGTLDAALGAGASRTAMVLEQTLKQIEAGHPCRTP